MAKELGAVAKSKKLLSSAVATRRGLDKRGGRRKMGKNSLK